jgi:biopolymer transport protein ExbB/TolQ
MARLLFCSWVPAIWEVFREMLDFVVVGTLFAVVITLVIGVLTLRNARRAAQLAEERNEYLLAEQTRLRALRDEHQGLREDLQSERQARWSLQEELKQERQARVEAQQRAEKAEQEALTRATQQLRKQMDQYLNELEEEGQPDIRRVK